MARIENNGNLNLSSFLAIDKKVTEFLPPSYKEGAHLSLLFTLTHNESLRSEVYKGFKEANEMRLFVYLRDHQDLEVNVPNIKKMFAVMIEAEAGGFRDKNLQILTGEKFYVPTSPEKIEAEMERLCEEFKHLNHPSPEDFDDVFKFILQFICIHPFHNGNGRLSAFLTEVLLTKFGLESALYLPFDALLNGIYIHKTTFEIRKASGFFYGMKEYDYDSYINYMKELLMKSYSLLLQTAKNAKLN